jgi:hypothetical protein
MYPPSYQGTNAVKKIAASGYFVGYPIVLRYFFIPCGWLDEAIG